MWRESNVMYVVQESIVKEVQVLVRGMLGDV